MRTTILLLCVTVSASCSLCRSYCEEHPVTKYEYLPASTSCLTEPPPVEHVVVPTADVSCPAQFALCLGADAGEALGHNITAYRRYSKEMWERCSARDAGGTQVDAGVDGGR